MQRSFIGTMGRGWKRAIEVPRQPFTRQLLFKLYKSYGGIDKFYSKKSYRVLCQIYAKLIAMTIFHSLANCLGLQQGKEFSPMKAFDYLKLRSLEVFLALRAGAHNLGVLLENIMDSWSRFCLKDRYRKKRPSTLSVMFQYIRYISGVKDS